MMSIGFILSYTAKLRQCYFSATLTKNKKTSVHNLRAVSNICRVILHMVEFTHQQTQADLHSHRWGFLPLLVPNPERNFSQGLETKQTMYFRCIEGLVAVDHAGSASTKLSGTSNRQRVTSRWHGTMGSSLALPCVSRSRQASIRAALVDLRSARNANRLNMAPLPIRSA